MLSIDNEAIRGCANLTEMYVRATNPPTIGNDSFSVPTSGIFVPAASLADYQSKWSSYASYLKAYNF